MGSASSACCAEMADSKANLAAEGEMEVDGWSSAGSLCKSIDASSSLFSRVSIIVGS